MVLILNTTPLYLVLFLFLWSINQLQTNSNVNWVVWSILIYYINDPQVINWFLIHCQGRTKVGVSLLEGLGGKFALSATTIVLYWHKLSFFWEKNLPCPLIYSTTITLLETIDWSLTWVLKAVKKCFEE